MRIPLLFLTLSTLSVAACDLGAYQPGGGGGDGGVPGGDFEQADAQFVAECSSCHGDPDSPAPPRAVNGDTETSSRGVGAHRSHLALNPTWHGPIQCEDCHTVPLETADPGHIDGDDVAEVSFTALATTGGLSPDWDGSRCSNVYCHGASLTGGSLTEPSWTTVDGSQAACGNCHGFPPPEPHSQSTDCGSCHPTIRPGTDEFLDPASHINGRVDVTDGQACDSCHGSGGESAPPRDLAGNTARTAAGVGAHRDHLGTSDWHREVTCSQCHVVPVETNDPGHMDGDDIAELTFDSLNAGAQFDRATSTCSNLYCHGNGGGTPGTAVWTQDLVLGCASCHDDGSRTGPRMSQEHRRHVSDKKEQCSECHDQVVNAQRVIIGAGLHIDGQRQVSFAQGGNYDPATRRCTNLACHENETW
jgi:predicted CxxxxCH...CXXCH cytochrome family protein